MKEKKCVYIISELSALALSIKKQVETLGFSAVPIFNPMEGIHLCITNKPYAVISDFSFNTIMGLEVLQQIKIKYNDIVSILLTNSENHPDVKRAIDLGCNILLKPVELKKLEEALKGEPKQEKNDKNLKNVIIVEKSANIRFQLKKLIKVPSDIVETINPFEFIEKYFLKQWDLIIFNVDNDYMSVDESLKTLIEKKVKPEICLLLAFEWTRLKEDKFISKGFSNFATIPLNESKISPIIDTILQYGSKR